ncbi:transcription antitermination factor NusB [Oceanobacillus halotolerans]|uniref:transcription antitermination factor NusB n=1 Tax=Oceanobacillus halotolerans TaxID=2663380 RepID=UPI0013D8EFF5|nr:transcription antitermination factor NusB [Oceanobacillus halotolerans]
MNRHTARENAFKILFQLDMNDDQLEEIEDDTDSIQVDDYGSKLVQGVREKREELDETISTHLEKWTINRIASVEKTVLRISLYEIKYLDDVPTNVSINEAVELANRYGEEKSGKFVNGVLSKIIS